MAVRVRYRRSELFEGETEVIQEANGYSVDSDNTLTLTWSEWNEDTEEFDSRDVGIIHPDRWDSAVALEDTNA